MEIKKTHRQSASPRPPPGDFVKVEPRWSQNKSAKKRGKLGEKSWLIKKVCSAKGISPPEIQHPAGGKDPVETIRGKGPRLCE